LRSIQAPTFFSSVLHLRWSLLPVPPTLLHRCSSKCDEATGEIPDFAPDISYDISGVHEAQSRLADMHGLDRSIKLPFVRYYPHSPFPSSLSCSPVPLPCIKMLIPFMQILAGVGGWLHFVSIPQ
jgi:hypothetical protein